MILIPGNAVTSRKSDKNFSQINTYKVEQYGEKVAVLALGDFYQKGEELTKNIEAQLGFKPTLINPRFANGLDEKLLKDLQKNHSIVITMEDGILDGGFGQKIASFYADKKMKVKIYGLKREFYDRYNPEELLQNLGISPEQIIADIKKMM